MKLAIASGKGGTGKTTLSVNLTSYIAEYHGDKFSEIILTDLDVEEPNSGLFLKGETLLEKKMYRKVPKWDKDKCTLCGECSKVCNFNALAFLKEFVIVFPELCHSCYACSELCPENALPMIDFPMGILNQRKISLKNSTFAFVESKLDIGQESAVPLIAETIDFVDENYNESAQKIYDSPPGTSCPMIEVLKDIDKLILITEPTPFGFYDLKLAVETARKMEKKVFVVINKYGIGNDDVEKYCKHENIPIIGKIPNSRKIAEFYSRGELLYKHFPEVKSELEKIYNSIL